VCIAAERFMGDAKVTMTLGITRKPVRRPLHGHEPGVWADGGWTMHAGNVVPLRG
jgi:hypothetical protein